jgi:REP element-mobilizing transposase RayT
VVGSDPALPGSTHLDILRAMILPRFTNLSWAFQLHYYLCFRTHRRRPLVVASVHEIISEICAHHDYHLLECQTQSDHVRTIISLKPADAIAKVTQTIKINSSRELPMAKPAWARGYLARSTGRMRIETVRQYLDQQAKHHNYESRILPPVSSFRAPQVRLLHSAHASFDLSDHLVFATRKRKGVFTSVMGKALTEYWLKVAVTREFAIDQISFVPDHVHLVVRIVPKMNIEECALSLMNNGQHFISKHYPHVFVECGIDQLWEASAYAGTCGDFTTALLKSWLRSS